MTQSEKLRIIADAYEGKVNIEVFFKKKWCLLNKSKLQSDRMYFETIDRELNFEMYSLMYHYNFRIAKSLPMLSDADADFAEKYLPHDWWITKDEDMKSYVEIHNIKPKRDADMWIQGSNAKQILVQLIFNFPEFESIKWENDDCYTIQELLDNYKENKK